MRGNCSNRLRALRLRRNAYAGVGDGDAQLQAVHIGTGVGAGVTAQTGLIGPLSTIMLSVVLLGEPFTIWMAAGTVLVLAGIWLLTRSKRASGAAPG